MIPRSAASAAHRTRVLSLLLALNVVGGCATAPMELPPSTEMPSATMPVAPLPTAVKMAGHAEAEPERQPEPRAAGLHAAQEALDRGDYVAAMREWESVAAGAPSARDRAHALLGMVMLRVLPSSTLVDPRAAEVVIAEFERHVRENVLRDEFGIDIALLHVLAARERELAALRDANRTLSADLAAREALIRKLRALSVDGG